MSPSPAPLRMELIPESGMERKGTVKVRPSWMSWLVVPVSPKYLVAAVELVWGGGGYLERRQRGCRGVCTL